MMDHIAALAPLVKGGPVTRAGHKYLKREPDGKGGWVYTYAHPRLGSITVEAEAGNEKGSYYLSSQAPSNFTRGVIDHAREHLRDNEIAPTPRKLTAVTESVAKEVQQREYDRRALAAAHSAAHPATRRDVPKYAEKFKARFGEYPRGHDAAHSGGEESKKSLDALDQLGALTKGFSGPQAGHKYVSRKPDGKGSWIYNYGEAHAAPKGRLPNLGIERVKMPQIVTDHRDEFLQGLRDKGVAVKHERIAAGALSPTQKGIHAALITGMPAGKSFAEEKPILVSREGYILDGHHRWAQVLGVDPKNTVNAIRIDLPIRRLLREAHGFGHVEYRKADALDALADLFKADGQMRQGHKYIRREAKAGGYDYTYREVKGADSKTAQRTTGTVDLSPEGRASAAQEGKDWLNPTAAARAKQPPKSKPSAGGLGERRASHKVMPFEGATKPAAAPDEDARLARTIGEFQQAIGAGKIKYDLTKHVQLAQAEIAAHNAALPALLSDLKAMAPGAKVKARVKALESVLGKLMRKSQQYGDASSLQDLTGARIVHEDVKSVLATVAALKKKYKVITEDNYIETPQGDYRSYHLIVEHEGRQKEIQVRTANQDTFAEWAHSVYKPMTPAQQMAVEAHGAEVSAYSKQASEYFWQRDNGKSGDPPGIPLCTKLISSTFGCVE